MEQNNTIRVFLLEDSLDDAALIERFFTVAREQDLRFRLEHATTLASALERLAATPCDIILSDLGLPDSAGLQTFEKVHSAFPDIPLVVLTGFDDEKIGLDAVHRGAQDYLIKGQITGKGLVRVIRYSIERQKLLTRLERSLQEIKALRRLLPICAWCKNIRDDRGYWKDVEAYITDHTGAVFTHGICPACAAKLKEQHPETFKGDIPTDDENDQ